MKTILKLAAFLPLLSTTACAREGRRQATPHRVENGMVVSQELRASKAGLAILRKGGNAVDAAIATAFALAVTHPAAGNIGGGGFMVVMLADGTSTTFDFRERAPAASSPDMFLDKDGKYDPARHHFSHLAVGVPGSVAGLQLAHQRLGKLPWRELVEPAVRLAARGFKVSPGLATDLAGRLKGFSRYPATLAQFSREGEAYQAVDVLKQKELAETLERIRDRGAAGFYQGKTAELLVAEMRRGGGLINLEDLRNYRAIERKPLRGTFRGYDIISMPPPSSGGVALVEMLNLLEHNGIDKTSFRSPREVHLLTEAMRRAYADRARHLADTDFVPVPVEKLTSKKYARSLSATIHPRKASRSSPTTFTWPVKGSETTHLSVVDSRRMSVALTTTLEYSYGSRIVVPGAGFLLNNEMGDFNPRAGLTTEKGLIGTKPNLVAPGKRMLSSMSPTIVAKAGVPVLVVGSPGGRTIINTVLGIIINHLVHGLPIQDAVDSPRLHHQWLPDKLLVEAGAITAATRLALEKMGHAVEQRGGSQGSAMAISVGKDGKLEAGCDRRRPDSAAAGY
ncbi:MAG: gamma-glutamyltransferase [Planctomycetota bacterium]|nr:gamma-glutamyltransferase [Planctomycetota bacterium]